MTEIDIDNFAKAFSSNFGSIRVECECGKIFYIDSPREGWDEGEFDSLKNNPNAISLDRCPSFIRFSGFEYCMDCDCWHEKAERTRNWLLAHKKQVAILFQLEKENLLKQAADIPTVKQSE